MKVIDVHPEELLDRELRGGLTAEQRTLLDVHLAHCESCRMERLLRADFASEAARAGEADMQSFVLGALQRAASSEVSSELSVALTPTAVSGTGARRRLTALMAVACVLLIAAGAAASRSAWVERMFHITFGEASIESGPTPLVRAKPRVVERPAVDVRSVPAPIGSAGPVTPAVVLPQAPVAQVEQVERPPEVEPTRLLPAPPSKQGEGGFKAARPAPNSYHPRTMRINNVRSSQSTTQAATNAKPAIVNAILVPQPAAPPDPAQIAVQQAASAMFEQGNRARRNGRLDQAATLYETLQREYASSPEAKLSFALSARMWLDAGKAFAAYGAFERYLASGDRALREEAMTGRALALERLGRKSAADAAFAELLQAYPYSSYAPLAKKRLGQD